MRLAYHQASHKVLSVCTCMYTLSVCTYMVSNKWCIYLDVDLCRERRRGTCPPWKKHWCRQDLCRNTI